MQIPQQNKKIKSTFVAATNLPDFVNYESHHKGDIMFR